MAMSLLYVENGLVKLCMGFRDDFVSMPNGFEKNLLKNKKFHLSRTLLFEQLMPPLPIQTSCLIEIFSPKQTNKIYIFDLIFRGLVQN
jgi:hypothetical protein